MFSTRLIILLMMLAVAIGCATGELENDGEPNQNQDDAGHLDTTPTLPDADASTDPDDANGDADTDADAGSGDDADAAAPDSGGDDGGIDLCPGGCDGNETCTDDGCVDLCATQGYQCGDWVIEGHSVTCGDCPSGECDQGQCGDICEEFHAQCGELFWDNESFDCGSCSGSDQCRYNQCAANAGYVDITLGNSHSCALRPNGEVRCWGGNTSGQLGDNNQPDESSSPRPVFSMNNAATINALSDHTCVTRDDSRVWCWGSNGSGRLGNGNTSDAPVPVEASGVTSAVNVTSGGGHTCALTNAGRLLCWGNNGQGQLGNGEVLSSPSFDHQKSNVRTQLGPDLENITEATLGTGFSCALLRDNSAWCWGFNNRGQLGLGDNSEGRRFASQLTALAPAQRIDSGFNHTCALAVDGDVYCWGRGSDGALGNGSNGDAYVPVHVALPGPAISVSAGRAHSCAALESGAVYCWGDNEFGQLGRGSFGSTFNTPQQVSGISDVHIVVAGGLHSCALTRSGNALCWGRNDVGQLGDDSTSDRNTPTGVVP